MGVLNGSFDDNLGWESGMSHDHKNMPCCWGEGSGRYMLNKARSNMYRWVTHTHTHLGGQCPRECCYCFVDNLRVPIAKGNPLSYTKWRFINNIHDITSTLGVATKLATITIERGKR